MRQLLPLLGLILFSPVASSLTATVPPCTDLEATQTRGLAVSPELYAFDRSVGQFPTEERVASSKDLVVSGLASQRPGDRRIAAKLLVRLPGREHERELASYLAGETSVDALLTFAAAATKHHSGSFTIPIYQTLLRCDQPGVRSKVLLHTARMYDSDVASALSEPVARVWPDLDDRAKASAIRSLSRSCDPAAVPVAFDAFLSLGDRESMRYAAQVVAGAGSRDDSARLVEIWVSKTTPRDSLYYPQRKPIFIASLDGIDGPSRPFLAALFDTEADEATRVEMATAALDRQSGMHNWPRQVWVPGTEDALLDEFNARFHAAYGASTGRMYPAIGVAARSRSTPEDRSSFWYRVLRMYPTPSPASAEACAALSHELESMGDLDRALTFAGLAAEIKPGLYDRQFRKLRQEVTERRSGKANGYLVASTIPLGDGRLAVRVENRNPFDVRIPSRAEGDLQIWLDCMSGSRVVESRPAAIQNGPQWFEVLRPASVTRWDLGDPGCRFEPETYIRARILMYPSEANDTHIGTITATGFIRTPDGRAWIPSLQAPTKSLP